MNADYKYLLKCVICGEKQFIVTARGLPVELVANVAVDFKCFRCAEESGKALRITVDSDE